MREIKLKYYYKDGIHKSNELKTKILTLEEIEKGEAQKLFRIISKVQDTGIKDINNKSIYAESSIVELLVHRESANINDYREFAVSKRGYFKYNKELLCYEIVGISPFGEHYNLSLNEVSNFEIIDTIQENKLGLIK